jgi:class 3 adenylate cyclase
VRLEFKIVLIILVTLALTFSALIAYNVSRQTEVMTRLHSQGSDLVISALVAGIRNVMLAGQGPYAREIVDEIRRNEELEVAGLRIYNKDGAEVYRWVDFDRMLDPAEPYDRAIQVIQQRDEGRELCYDTEITIDGQVIQKCTIALPADTAQTKVGALDLELALQSVTQLYGEAMYSEATRIPVEAIVQGYKTIMLSGKAEFMSNYAKLASELPGIVSLQVFDNQGHRTQFGDDNLPVDQDLNFYLSEALGSVPVAFFERANPSVYTQLLPLENEPRCWPCHGRDHWVRGVIRLSIDTRNFQDKRSVTDFAATMAHDAVAHTVNSVLQFGGKDVFVLDYIDNLRFLPEVRDIRLYSPEGRHIMTDAMPGAMSRHAEVVSKVLESVEPARLIESRGDSGRFLTDFAPIANGVQCWQCHTDDHKVRAVIEVSRSLAGIDGQISRSRIFTILAGILSIVLIWISINVFMRRVVVQPINHMADVVRGVGEGDLTARTIVANSDEIGFLAGQINAMVEGLMKKFHLEKFVSGHTIEAVDQAGEVGVKLGGMRRDVVVLFSDVRGFTAFSESIPPEQVVAMLNVYLRAQAKVISAHGGQIDKYVGDEIVAVFQADDLADAARRAVRAGKQMQRILDKLRESGKVPRVHVGIGVNAGSVVMGAIGTEERMDYTVIGDTVNTGARLCSAAGKGEIIISESIAELVADVETLRSIEPINVKNKSEPLVVYLVEYDLDQRGDGSRVFNAAPDGQDAPSEESILGSESDAEDASNDDEVEGRT